MFKIPSKLIISVLVLLTAGTAVLATRNNSRDALAIVAPPPGISSVNPNSGPVSGGTTVSINGSDFSSDAIVFFGNTVGTVQNYSSTKLTVITPPHPAGTVDIYLSENSGMTIFPASFTFLDNTSEDACSKKQKVTICHIPPGNIENPHTLCLPSEAIPAHLAHGDYLGRCLNEKQRGNNDFTEDQDHEENSHSDGTNQYKEK